MLLQISSENHTTAFTYDAETRLTAQTYDGGNAGRTTATYDAFGRMSVSTVKVGTGAEYSTTYTFVPGVGSNTTPLVQSITQQHDNFTYAYDNVGNISSVTQNDGTTSYTTSYVYDAIGQLIRVDDRNDKTSGDNGTTWRYTYDLGGNILTKQRFAWFHVLIN